jgi:hypothetical protein
LQLYYAQSSLHSQTGLRQLVSNSGVRTVTYTLKFHHASLTLESLDVSKQS